MTAVDIVFKNNIFITLTVLLSTQVYKWVQQRVAVDALVGLFNLVMFHNNLMETTIPTVAS